MFNGTNLLKEHAFDLVVNTSHEDVSHAVKRMQMYAMSNEPRAIKSLLKYS
jgi:hypothetical protein